MLPGVDIAVIVRHWNAGEFVERCIDDFLKANASSTLSFRFIVCSDGSFDGSESKIQPRHNLDMLSLSPRHEYCAALNYAASFAVRAFRPRFLLFLNADLIHFSSGFADALVRTSQEDDLVWVTPGIVDVKGKNISQLRSSTRIGLEFPLSTECHLIRSDVFEDFGGFDETLVRYYEDVDLYTRVREAGHVCGLTQDAWVTHLGSGLSSRQVFVRVYFGVRNPIVIWYRHRPMTDLWACLRAIRSHCHPRVVGRARPLWFARLLWIAGLVFGVLSGVHHVIVWRGRLVTAAKMRQFVWRRSVLLGFDRPLEVWASKRGSLAH